MEIKVPIIVTKPALIPNKLNKIETNSSEVVGINKSETETLLGSANFITFTIAFIVNKQSRKIETNLACLLKLGNLFLIPRPNMVPCNTPTPTTTAKVIRKFFSTKSMGSKRVTWIGKMKCYLV